MKKVAEAIGEPVDLEADNAAELERKADAYKEAEEEKTQKKTIALTKLPPTKQLARYTDLFSTHKVRLLRVAYETQTLIENNPDLHTELAEYIKLVVDLYDEARKLSEPYRNQRKVDGTEDGVV